MSNTCSKYFIFHEAGQAQVQFHLVFSFHREYWWQLSWRFLTALCVFGEFVENESMCVDHLFEKGDQCPGQGWSEANHEVLSCFCLARFSPQLEGMKEGLVPPPQGVVSTSFPFPSSLSNQNIIFRLRKPRKWRSPDWGQQDLIEDCSEGLS